jgi:MFS transporter, ACS family, aldohexuronate transporter
VFYQLPEKSSVSAVELTYLRSDPEDATKPIALRTLLTLNQAWAVASGKFFTDPFWYVYLFWIPDFLSRKFNMDLRGMALTLFVIYTGASMGSITGGWLSSFLLKAGWPLNASGKTASWSARWPLHRLCWRRALRMRGSRCC